MRINLGKLVAVLVLAGMLVAGVAAFAAEKTYTIYVVVHGGIADPFWKVCEKGAKDAGALYPDLKLSLIHI